MPETRRGLLRTVDAGAAGVGALTGATDTVAAECRYRRVPTDTDRPLFDVDVGRHTVAVGANGVVLERH